MATTEHTGLMTYKDENGNLYLLYPITTKDAVEGLDEIEALAKNAVPLDGSKPMTGALNLQTVNNGSGRLQKSHSATADYGTIVRDYDKNGNFLSVVIRAALGTVSVAGSDGVAKEIYHTGNKPSGSYTGNGSATARTINTGGIGNVCVVWSAYSLAIVTPGGAIVRNEANAYGLTPAQCKFQNGVLTIATTGDSVNFSGVAYTYQVL